MMKSDGETPREKKAKPPARRYYRKRIELFRLIDKIKLWPSRKGILHGIRSIEKAGDQARITTHCNKIFMVNNSRNSRAARWLRNKWFKDVCSSCDIPGWKLEKYSSTRFKRHYGSLLNSGYDPDKGNKE
jgi:pyrrolysyl-tRNA synthetase-like protein